MTLQILSSSDKFEVKDWQEEDLDYLCSLSNSANWSEMGAYKSSTGLWLINRKVKEAGNVLIVTTKSGKGAYFTALPKCLDDDWRVFNVGTRLVEEMVLGDVRLEYDIDDLVSRLIQRNQKTIILAHYHCFVRKAQICEILIGGSETGKIQWDFVLLDEAHKIKSKDVQWTRSLKKLAHARKQEHLYRHVMTGTAFVNNPAEMWSLVNFLEPQEFPSYWRFRRAFCEEENWNGYDKIVGIRDDKIDEFVALRKHLGPRRKMSEVHKNIAEPIFDAKEVDLNPTQLRMQKEIIKELRMLDQQGFAIDSPNVVSQLQRLRQIAVATPELIDTYYDDKKQRRVQVVKLVEPSSKLDQVMEILEELDSKQQVVIFSSFKDPLELLKVRFIKAGITFLHMEQKDSEATRFEKWHNIFPKNEHQVFLSTIDLGGESINLSCAQYCIFLDRSWSPAKNSQAIGRVYRPGQTGIAEIIHINARKTVDAKVLANVTQKLNWFAQLF